jgi:hypothetical protein
MTDPVCVIIYREPLSNAISLAENAKKSDGAGPERMTVKRWLTAWEEGASAATFPPEQEARICLASCSLPLAFTN